MKFDNLETLTLAWHIERNLIDGCDYATQFAALVEEVGEIAKGMKREGQQGLDERRDAIGDTLVVLTNLAARDGLTLSDCLETAYDEIKDRKGRMINGRFVKEADLAKEKCLNCHSEVDASRQAQGNPFCSADCEHEFHDYPTSDEEMAELQATWDNAKALKNCADCGKPSEPQKLDPASGYCYECVNFHEEQAAQEAGW